MLKTICLVLILCLFSLPLLAHEESGEKDPLEMSLRFGVALEKISILDFTQIDQNRPAVPFIKMGRKVVMLDSAFYRLAEEISRTYINEISEICPECKLPSPEEVRLEAENLMHKGWLKENAGRLGRTVGLRYGSEFVDLGSRYGVTAGLIKVAGEVAEDALLVIFKMPGAHFLCEWITFIVSYYSGSVLTVFRTFFHARHLQRNGWAQLARLLATTMVTRRAFKKIALQTGPVEIAPELRGLLPPEKAQQQWLLHEFSEEKHYERFLLGLAEKSKAEYAKILALKAQGNAETSRSIQRQIAQAQKRIANYTRVSRKVFEGRRMGYTLYIFKRRRAMTLASNEHELNRFFRGSKLWMLPLTADFTNPGLNLETENPRLLNDFIQRTQSHKTSGQDSVTQWLLTEAEQKGLQRSVLLPLFQDLSILFDPNSPRADKRIQLAMVEGLLSDFLPRLNRAYLGFLRDELTLNGTNWRTLKAITKLQWSVGQMTYNTNQYLDYLRMVSLAPLRGPETFERERALNYFKDIFKNFALLAELKDVPDISEIERVQKELNKNLKHLSASRFWIEKRATFSILPLGEWTLRTLGIGQSQQWLRRRVKCEQLYY